MSESIRSSANLGFLWTHYDLPKAVQAASESGFDAVDFIIRTTQIDRCCVRRLMILASRSWG